MTKITITLPDERARELKEIASRTGVKAEEWLRSRVEAALEKEGAHPRKASVQALQAFWGSLPKGFVPPSDAEVEQILQERRTRKYG